jgi:hypothetical protein
MWLAALAGFMGLGFEIVWFRVFALASADSRDRLSVDSVNCEKRSLPRHLIN